MQNVVLGLEGVVVAETELSLVDGENGRLVLRGYEAERAAERFSFTEIAGLFVDGEPRDLAAELGRARVFAFERLERLGDALEAADAMDALRTAISHLPPAEGDRATAIRLLGAAPVFAASWARKREGRAPVAPDPAASHAADYLRMLHGRPVPDPWARALDRYLVTVSDHGMNASTFAARVVASTESDAVSAIVAAIGALKGRLHGGAPGPVLTMLDEIGTIERARPYIEAELDAGRRIMGLGHRVYRVRDPRAHVLERAIELIGEGADPARLALARAVEKVSVEVLTERKPDRALRANVEFYTAVLLEAVGIHRDLFTATFACGRTAGWAAHVMEQRRQKKLIRPSSRYVGPGA
jgi:citrate synthase